MRSADFNIYPYLAVFCLLLSTGCIDSTRIDKLESDIRALKSDDHPKIAELRERIEQLEDGGGGSAASASPINEKINRLEDRLTQLLEQEDPSGKMAYLRANFSGHTIMQTDHGPFLVRLEGIDLNVGGIGYTARLNIGNPLSLSVNRFTLTGDFGSGAPILAPGETYSVYNQQVEEWQRTLTPFKVSVDRMLKPSTWTPVDVPINAKSRDELQLIRVSMIIENADLEGVSTEQTASGEAFSHIRVDSNSAAILKTEYGAFLIVVKKAESMGSDTRLEVEIGNPVGFVINQCRLVGEFGQVIPKRRPGEGEGDFLARRQEWATSLKPFNYQISTKLSPFRWNPATIIVPGRPDQVKFIRGKLNIEYVTLPHR